MGKVKEAPKHTGAARVGMKVGMLQRHQVWFSSDLCKRNQGRKVRQSTFFGSAFLVGLGVWRLKTQLEGMTDYAAIKFGVPAVLLAVGLWVSFRLVNLPRFADFLIATEAEMNKVSWPTMLALRRATAVVLVTLVLMVLFLFACDLFWQQLLHLLKILQ